MKTPEQITKAIVNRLASTWSQTAAGASADDPPWPKQFALGEPSRAVLSTQFADFQAVTLAWRRWHSDHAHLGVQLTEATRTVHRSLQPIPTHIVVPDVTAAVAVAGPQWQARMDRARMRAETITTQFGPLADLPRLLRDVDTWDEVDFQLLCDAAAWFSTHDATGLTPRQVPIPGMHAKWLNTRRAQVAALAGADRLPLAPAHPPRVHLTYLDPDHRAAGGRRHDCVSVGDNVELPYNPRVVVISENKDTAVAFPTVPGGVAVEGGGFGGATAAALSWLTDAPVLVYWGDIDAAGFEILDGFRAAGVPARSMLMDQATYDTYERFGTSVERHGHPLGPGVRRDLVNLTGPELALYTALTEPGWTRHRRLEQERIPLTVAAAALADISGQRRADI